MSRLPVRHVRWSVPLLVVGTVAAGAQLTSSAAASSPELPPVSAQQLLVRAGTTAPQPYSGEVRLRTALGLPALPQQGSTDWSALVSGTHTLRVAQDGPRLQRVDLIGDLAQASVVRDGRQLWTWSSTTRRATRTTLPAPGPQRRPGSPAVPTTPQRVPLTPDEAARQALAAVGASTEVSVGRAARVAGRSAYVLQLTPRDARSLVSGVRIYLDARTSTVLRTTVGARGHAEPAVDVAFTRLRLAAPAASTFRFAPPPGVQVREVPLPSFRRPDAGGPTEPQAGGQPRVHGSGWTSVLQTPTLPVLVGQDGQGDRGAPAAALLRASTPVRGTFGTGRLLRTRLLTVLQTQDGRVFAGAVTAAELLRVAEAAQATTAR